MTDDANQPPARSGDESGPTDEGRGEVLLYQTPDGRTRLECRFADETIWLSQALMAELYQTSKQNISLHLKNLYDDGEIDPDRAVKEYLTTAADGKRYRGDARGVGRAWGQSVK